MVFAPEGVIPVLEYQIETSRSHPYYRFMEPCWEWSGAIDKDGYGKLVVRRPDRTKTVESVHRLSFEWANGRPGLPMVLHTCHNRRCWNPDHLYEGDNLQNMKDRAQPGRNRSGHDRMTMEKAMDIRGMHQLGWTQASLAKLYGIGYNTVNDIILVKCWKPA